MDLRYVYNSQVKTIVVGNIAKMILNHLLACEWIGQKPSTYHIQNRKTQFTVTCWLCTLTNSSSRYWYGVPKAALCNDTYTYDNMQ